MSVENKVYIAEMIRDGSWKEPIEIGLLTECNIKPKEITKVTNNEIDSTFLHNDIYIIGKWYDNINISKHKKYALLIEWNSGKYPTYMTFYKCILFNHDINILHFRSYGLKDINGTVSLYEVDKLKYWAKKVKLPVIVYS